MTPGALHFIKTLMLVALTLYFYGYACLRRFCDDPSRDNLEIWGRRFGKAAAVFVWMAIAFGLAAWLTGVVA
jgi:hypothetical protein